MKEGVTIAGQSATKYTVESLAYGYVKTKEAAAATTQVAGAAWNPVKQKLDESGTTEIAKQGYNTVATNSKLAATAINQKIEANPSLKYAKDVTAGGLYAAGSMVKTGIGSLGSWFGYKAAAQTQENSQLEEQKESDHQVSLDAKEP